MKSHDIRAVFFDVDGTLTSFTTHEVPASTITALQRLRECGVLVFICTGRAPEEIAEEIGMGGSGQLKKYVTKAVNGYFEPIRERRHAFEQDLDYVKDVLHEGNRRANEIAEATLAEVREAMGMVY